MICVVQIQYGNAALEQQQSYKFWLEFAFMHLHACVYSMKATSLDVCTLVCLSIRVYVGYVRVWVRACVCVEALFCMPQSLCQLESERLTLVINI